MSKLNEVPQSEQFAQPENPEATGTVASPAARKEFIEPAISVPVDVLEATTFFQTTVASGGDTDV